MQQPTEEEVTPYCIAHQETENGYVNHFLPVGHLQLDVKTKVATMPRLPYGLYQCIVATHVLYRSREERKERDKIQTKQINKLCTK